MPLGLGPRYGAQERLGVRVDGRVEDLFHPAEFGQAAEVHDHHAVTYVLDNRQVVRDEDDGETKVPPQRFKQVEDLGLNRDVQSGDRLVGHQELRLERQRSCYGNTLLLAPGQLMGASPGQEARQPHPVHQFADANADVVLASLFCRRREVHGLCVRRSNGGRANFAGPGKRVGYGGEAQFGAHG